MVKENNNNNTSDDEFDDDDELSKIREARIKQMKEEAKAKQMLLNNSGHGEYKTIDEKEFLKEVTASANVVVHFYHNTFVRCKLLDKHLEILAKTHIGTKFLKIDAERAIFFVEKLGVRVLPTLVFFHNGIAVDRTVGFDDFGGKDDFKIEALAKRIAKSGVLDFKHTTGLKVISKSDKFLNKEDD
ncbi:hypothetical protein CYY_002153 [Polysphondylium violaceum]|uniref:Thioredoxin domain-containing protein n=1 Tax=Polysphondylium violaceum TaxID=133409 RepID=A0A8J4Q221_9MYCE|nr:hypothetical protein CYY_002153 [Polysphondylium violaceum]